MVQRMCFQLQVRPERMEQYRQSHAAVWPEMLAALQTSGWRNYSLFLRPDGLLIGYFEADDVDAAMAAMSAQEVNTRWQSTMSGLLVGDAGSPLVRLPQVFHLGDQLPAAEAAGEVAHHQIGGSVPGHLSHVQQGA